MNQHIDFSDIIAKGKISKRQAEEVSAVLADILFQDLGYTKFVPQWDNIAQRIEILFMRDDDLGWFRINSPSVKTVERFIAALPWLARQEPQLADWQSSKFLRTA